MPTINSAGEMAAFAGEFSKTLHPHDGASVIALHGELGAGKTTFMKALAGALGVAEVVTSPTFVLEKIYQLNGQAFDHLIHIDAYRLEHFEELRSLGWNTIAADPGNLICIEWAERVKELLPSDTRHLSFTVVSETVRDVSESLYGENNKK